MRNKTSAAAPASNIVTPDLTTYTSVLAACWDDVSSTISGNNVTFVATATKGELNAAMTVGGLVSPDLGLTLSDYKAVTLEFDCPNIDGGGGGAIGGFVGLINTTTLEVKKCVVAGVSRLAGNAYRIGAATMGLSGMPNNSAQHNTVFGRLRVTIPITDTGIPVQAYVGGEQASRPAEAGWPAGVEAVAFDTGVRICVFLYVESSNAGNVGREVQLENLTYEFHAKAAA
jgi:hypothetical protein